MVLTPMNFKEVDDLAEQMTENSDWRPGQCYFNALYVLFPDIANSIRGGCKDPFHDYCTIEETKEYLNEMYGEDLLDKTKGEAFSDEYEAQMSFMQGMREDVSSRDI